MLINTHVTGEWNHPGVLNVIADSTLVVIYCHQIAKLDPETGDILAQISLPTGSSEPGDTGYAGLQYYLTTDGHIIGLQVTPAQSPPTED